MTPPKKMFFVDGYWNIVQHDKSEQRKNAYISVEWLEKYCAEADKISEFANIMNIKEFLKAIKE